MTGLRSNDLPTTKLADSAVVNYQGSTRKISITDLGSLVGNGGSGPSSSLAAEVNDRIAATRDTGVLPLTGYGGTADAITADLTTSSGVTSLSSTTTVELITTAANTGPVTLNVAGAGSWPVQKRTGAALVAGDLRVGATYLLRRRSSAWRIVGMVDSDADAKVAAEAVLRSNATRDTGVLPLANVAGTIEAITADLSAASGVTSLSSTTTVELIPAATNTGPVTLNVAGAGAWPVQKRTGAALVAGDLRIGATYLLRRRSSTWRIVGVVDSEVDMKVESEAAARVAGDAAEAESRATAVAEVFSMTAATEDRLNQSMGQLFDEHGYIAAIGGRDGTIAFGLRSDGTAEVSGKVLATRADLTTDYQTLDARAPFSTLTPTSDELVVGVGSKTGHLAAQIDAKGVGSWGYQPRGVHLFSDGQSVSLISYKGKIRQVTSGHPTTQPHWFGARLRCIETRSGVAAVREIGPDWGVVPYAEAKYPKVAILCGMGQSLMEGAGHLATNVSAAGIVGAADRSLMMQAGSFSPLAPNNTAQIDDDNRSLVAAQALTREVPTHQASLLLADGLAVDEGLFVTNHARGGYNIQQLKKGGTSDIYERWQKRLDSFGLWASVRDIEISRAIMIWQQGQSGGYSTEQQYRDFLLQMWEDIQADVAARAGRLVPTLIVTAPLNHRGMVTGWHPKDGWNLGATGAQLWAPLTHPTKFACAGPDYHIARTDGTHMTSAGYALIGAMFGRAINRWTATAGAWRPLHLSAAVRTGNQIKLTFAGGDGPLVFDEWSGTPPALQGVRPIENKGVFWYQDGGTPATITGVSITAPREITVTLSANPGTTAGEWITLGVSGIFAGTNEGFVDGDPATMTGGATNIRTNPPVPETSKLGVPLYDWAVQQIVKL